MTDSLRILKVSHAAPSITCHTKHSFVMPSTISVLAAGVLVPVLGAVAAKLPSMAQIIDQKSFNVLKDVPPPAVANDSLVCHCSPVTDCY